ncbi:TPA: HEPN domain-containing protein [Candidatus Poribacteria bacterium]|nr:HEPN domain-containing protein [Candidatus Poribacteria bacterium]
MQPIEFLNLAHKLIDSADEAELRTAISRAYYYVYHSIKNDLVGSDTNLTHDVMINCIQEANINGNKVAEFEELGQTIRDLKTDRIFADYKINKSLSQETCHTMIKRCETAVEDFKECKRLGIIDAARNYLRQYKYI